ncbi:hypothetical protein [Hymenobacter sp. DG25B]|uniref:hypothetical protein n=1 Tax=Hymenobacter sp. DG25B TaxID=1385664 RepID=UPI000A760017|nr:hypothetical protein [Hymenobacter sp. DG25B]
MAKIALQYYQRPFQLFHKFISNKYTSDTNHIRTSFWSLVPNGVYSDIRAQDLFWSYAKSLESKSGKIVGQYSMAYWLHLSRRIGINSGGPNKEASTIETNRINIIALIQKYGTKTICNHINTSKEIDIKSIFNGLLLSKEFEYERKIIEQSPSQLVLTDFDHNNLLEYYEVEKISYELWVCGAKLRAIGKGAKVHVSQALPEFFIEERDNNLARLIENYDNRLSSTSASETGTMFQEAKPKSSSLILLPILNVQGESIAYMNDFFKSNLNFIISDEQAVNYLLIPYPIRKYLKSHLPFEKDFIKQNKVNFKHIITLITSLCWRALHLTIEERSSIYINWISRGYEGPSTKEGIIGEAYYYSPIAGKILKEEETTIEQLTSAFEYLENRHQENVNIFDRGTLKLLIQTGENHYFIDYSLIPIILNNLFDKISLNEHGFRGPLFEEAIEKKSYLPTTPCKGLDRSSKQIDFSHLIGDVLIIAECKAAARRSSFFNGSHNALKLRESKVIEKGITQIEQKAQWLIQHKKGTNYNIENVKYIIPVAISPFVEYIPYTSKRYWLNDILPRVLSIDEFLELINSFDISDIKYNIVEI